MATGYAKRQARPAAPTRSRRLATWLAAMLLLGGVAAALWSAPVRTPQAAADARH